jgi:hypothetical protein
MWTGFKTIDLCEENGVSVTLLIPLFNWKLGLG